MTAPNIQVANAIALLKEHGFAVLEPFAAPTVYLEGEPKEPALGVVLDTETTGTDGEKCGLVELGMVFFEYDQKTGIVYRITDVFDELHDPGIPIPPDATKVNGITDDMVKGKAINVKDVTDRVTFVNIVIAHNAGFDRRVCERYFPVFAQLPWACSFRQVPWLEEDMASAKLEYIAFRRGFHYAAHRAETDCRALLHVLQAPLGNTGMTTLKALLDQANRKEMRIWATDTPFSMKDRLKDRGYRWGDGTNGQEKAWYCDVSDDAFEAELAWLKENVYDNRRSAVVVDTVDALTRFSSRRGKSQRQYL